MEDDDSAPQKAVGDEKCKAAGLRVLDARGCIEDSVVRGWDVFVPIWSLQD